MIRKLFQISFIAFIGWVCFGCNNVAQHRSKLDFVAEPYSVIDNVKIEQLKINRRILGGENYDAMSANVYDSLCVLYQRQTNHFFAIHNMNTGEMVGNFVRKGNGPLETTNASIIHNIYEENGELKTIVYDHNKFRLMICNISKTIEVGTSVYDTIIPLSRQITNGRYVSYTSPTKDGDFCIRLNVQVFEELRKVVPPKFAILSRDNMQLKKEYNIFRDSIVDFSEVDKWRAEDPFEGHQALNRDKNKFVYAMTYLPQINILDLETNKLKSVRIKGTRIETTKEQYYYYTVVRTDKDYIYALYQDRNSWIPPTPAGTPVDKIYKGRKPSEVHIFDWNGNLVRRCQLEGFYHSIDVYQGKIYAFLFYSGMINEYLL